MDVKAKSLTNNLISAMVKFKCSMNLTKQPVSFPRPSPMKALTAGFDAISSHVVLVLFSIILDVFLWLGPRLRVVSLLNSAIEGARLAPSIETGDVLNQLKLTIPDLNFFSILRTYPVGIPSLMAARLSSGTPMGTASGWDIPTAPLALTLWLLLLIVGIAAGTFFFTLVAQSALTGKVFWKDALKQWPRSSVQIGILALTCLFLILAAFIPFSCLAAVVLSGAGLGQAGNLILLIFVGLIIWLFAPLLFSPHGIIIHQYNALTSILRGFYLARLTLPSTSLLLLIFLLLSEGLKVLWNIPTNSSWWLLLGIVGHAFVTTSLLASSFVYYRDAESWVNELVKEIKLSSA
jgi:hypothetical protein